MKDKGLPRHTCRSILLLLFAALGGCAGTSEFSCDMHETRTRGIKPFTTYKPAEPRRSDAAIRVLPAGSAAQAPTYELSFKPGFTKPCSDIILYKNVVILRSNEPAVVLNEIREFYAEDGTLIASATQDISDQVRRSGAFVATTPLPIPKSAPPGKYRIVSKLMFEKRNDRHTPVQIARTEGHFYIIPMQ